MRERIEVTRREMKKKGSQVFVSRADVALGVDDAIVIHSPL